MVTENVPEVLKIYSVLASLTSEDFIVYLG